uniref:EF-hand domain-containing protein n=1 Tax=Alexandrium monilatum TaxID=311494 RepID=A0A7S4QIL0_9DINO
MTNFLTMLLELRHKDLDFTLVNSLFVIFYTAELVVHLTVQGSGLLVGRPSVVWWSWVDLLVVISGLVELVLHHLEHLEGGWMCATEVLRLVRLVRLVKLVRLFATADVSWADEPTFHSVMMAVIGANTVLMGLELAYEGLAVWVFLESVLLMVYIFELLVRIRHRRCRFFCSSDVGDLAWNWLDFVIVLSGTFDTWVMPIVDEVSASMGGERLGGQLSSVLSLMRIARLARLLQLMRLVKSIPPLYLLAVGIAEAMQGMGWVFILTVGVLYICAVIGVQLVGQGWALPPSLTNDELREAEDTFDDIPDAVFNLFKAMNADLGAFGPLFHAVPGSKWVMMAFMIVMNWAIFSILTAVVSDNMSKATEAHGREEEERAAAEASERRAKLIELVLSHLDKDGNGEISLREVEELFRDEVEVEALRALTGLEEEDIHGILELVENEGGGTITHADFRALMQHGYSEVTAHSLMKFETRLHGLERLLTRAANGRMRRHSTL